MKLLITLFMAAGIINTSDPEPEMVVGAASTGPDETFEISDEASRAPYFLIFSSSGELINVIDNTNVARRRAGPATAELLVEQGVTHYLALKFGRNLIIALDNAGIERIETDEGTVEEAIKLFIEERAKAECKC